ncbi:MAG TPA: hypothetical protein PKW06_06630 [Cyclobacteriaceae bacterium]|nr:hypothetical protein [Cyclobacteriaceae bacterium]
MKQKEEKQQEKPRIKLGANWGKLRGMIKRDFPNVTNSDLQFMSRGENELIGRLQVKSGKTKSQIRDWVRNSSKII